MWYLLRGEEGKREYVFLQLYGQHPSITYRYSIVYMNVIGVRFHGNDVVFPSVNK